MKGKIVSVNISKSKGERKHNIGECRLIEAFGVEQDAHAGTEERQVSLLAVESIEKIRQKGLAVGCGDFAENITTEGLILHHLPVGTELRIGEGVLLRITRIGKICHDRCAIYYQAGDCVMPREGVFAEVLTGGKVKVGDEIEIEFQK